ncbi:MAG TPA: hypothetical protein VNT01_14525 [Symbiobacteriaceae bacterium]|nr:hypothetical protein [Symbiobacteriaceae bacterium]
MAKSCSWTWTGRTSPATMELYKVADWALLEVAEMLGMVTNQVVKIRAARLENEKKIYIVPADKVSWLRTGCWWSWGRWRSSTW